MILIWSRSPSLPPPAVSVSVSVSPSLDEVVVFTESVIASSLAVPFGCALDWSVMDDGSSDATRTGSENVRESSPESRSSADETRRGRVVSAMKRDGSQSRRDLDRAGPAVQIPGDEREHHGSLLRIVHVVLARPASLSSDAPVAVGTVPHSRLARVQRRHDADDVRVFSRRPTPVA